MPIPFVLQILEIFYYVQIAKHKPLRRTFLYPNNSFLVKFAYKDIHVLN